MHCWVVGVIRGRDRIATALKGASQRQRRHHKYETDVGWHFKKKCLQSPPLLRLVFWTEEPDILQLSTLPSLFALILWNQRCIDYTPFIWHVSYWVMEPRKTSKYPLHPEHLIWHLIYPCESLFSATPFRKIKRLVFKKGGKCTCEHENLRVI